jgi:hypothetical protein
MGVDLRHPFRIALLALLALLAVIGTILPAGNGARADRQPAGHTAQGEAIRLKIVGGDLRSLATRVRLECTDGRVWAVAWSPSSGIRHSGAGVSVLQTDHGAHVTARLDGELGNHPQGTLRAIGARNGVRCDSGAVRWAA